MSVNDIADKFVQEQSIGNASSGISDAFVESRASLKRYVERFVTQPQDIEDILHEAYLQSYVAELGARIEFPKSFLFKTAKNLALKHNYSCANRLVDHFGDMDSLQVLIDDESAENRAETQENFQAFCEAVSSLPAQCRKAFILRKVYGLTHREVAETLEISVSTVEKHLATGLLKCNEYMRVVGYKNTARSSR